MAATPSGNGTAAGGPAQKTLVGFGFGAIQTGLFLWEAQRSGNFERLVVAVPNPALVAAVRHAGGRFRINIATAHGREVGEVAGVEMCDPAVAADRAVLIEAIADADEVATALPSVATYDEPGRGIAPLLALGLREKLRRLRPKPCILYAAENHNHAAEILWEALGRCLFADELTQLSQICQGVDTVIGKMSRIVREPEEIAAAGLEPFVVGGPRAYLVEEFNRILISRITLPGYERGIRVFEEKADLLPFEEAKLYGHNAAHALLGYVARERGLRYIAEAGEDQALLDWVRTAFLEESGRSIIGRWSGLDPLFTPAGYANFAEDLLLRMVNPWLRDDVDRVTRDPRRKLGWDDRLVGTIRLALGQGLKAVRFAHGAAVALQGWQRESGGQSLEALLAEAWRGPAAPAEERAQVCELILAATDPSAAGLARQGGPSRLLPPKSGMPQ